VSGSARSGGAGGGSGHGVEFLVVGSPRSGTTLVQRLACEIPGVGMPAETHFFTQFAAGLLARHRFPIVGDVLAQEIGRFAALDSSRGLDVDIGVLVDDLEGVCESPYALFDALVCRLAGPAEVWGEKTPEHLLWWRPLARAAPWLRFVVVVRDPRAVVASNLSMPWRDGGRIPAWGENVHLAFAELWACLQRQVQIMAGALGPDRVLVLRYEDVVADPDASRRDLARFLGRPPVTTPVPAPDAIVQSWEPWKTEALGPVVAEHIDTWRETLGPARARQVTAVCRAGMRRFGYGHDAPSTATAAARRVALGPRQILRSLRYRRAYRGYLATIDRRQL
jgi:hypothetical protein